MNELYIPPEGGTERCTLDLPVELSRELLNNKMISDKIIFKDILKLPVTVFEKYLLGKLYSQIGTKEMMELNSYLDLTSTGKVLFILFKNKHIPIKKISSSENTVMLQTQYKYLKISIAVVTKYFKSNVHLDKNNKKIIFQIAGRK